jgi:CRISPR-associated protein Csx3
MLLYNIRLDGDTMNVSFGAPSTNDSIVREVTETLKDMAGDGTLEGGPLLKINGPASLPVAFVLAHAVLHIYGVVAVRDPKLGKYVVVASHAPDYSVGDLID